MKNLFVALAIVFGLCLQSAAAQTETQQMPKEKTRAEVVDNVKAELAKIAKELNLTTDQKAQFKTILTEQSEKIQAIREDSRGKMRAVLTPDQQAKWDKMKSEHAMKSEPKKEMNEMKGMK